MPEEVFRVENVYIKENGSHWLEDINIYLLKGELLGIVGKIHSGSNILRKVLLGEMIPEKGAVYFSGQPGEFGPNIKTRIGKIGKESLLVENMSVAENLYLLRKKHSWICNEKKLILFADRLLGMMGLDITAGMKVSELTSIQKKMIEIIKMALIGIRIFLIDDDICYTEKDSEELYRMIQIFQKRGLSFLCFSNKPNYLLQKADRIIAFRHHHIAGYVAGNKVEKTDFLKLMGVSSWSNMEGARQREEDTILYKIQIGEGENLEEILVHGNEMICFLSLDTNATSLITQMFLQTNQKKVTSVETMIDGVLWRIQQIHCKELSFLPYDFRDSMICSDMTVYENAYMNMREGYFKQRKYFAKQLDHIFKRPKGWSTTCKAGELTSQEQRAILSFRSFIGYQKLVLMTYPTEGTNQILSAAKQKGLSVVMITDSIEEARETCDKILVVERGRIRQTIRKKES